MMLARPDEVGPGGCGGCGLLLRGAGKAEQAKTSELKTSKTLQCCHLQAKTFQADSINVVFRRFTMKNMPNRGRRPEPQTQNPAKS